MNKFFLNTSIPLLTILLTTACSTNKNSEEPRHDIKIDVKVKNDRTEDFLIYSLNSKNSFIKSTNKEEKEGGEKEEFEIGSYTTGVEYFISPSNNCYKKTTKLKKLKEENGIKTPVLSVYTDKVDCKYDALNEIFKIDTFNNK